MHLAVVQHTVTDDDRDSCCDSDDEETRMRNEDCTRISHWINSNDIECSLDLELDWENQCVGSIRNLLTSSGIEPYDTSVSINYYDETPIYKRHYRHAILVIWPKNETLKMYWRYGLSSLLDRMGVSLNSTRRGEEDARKIVTQNLSEIISFCSEDPAKVWMKSAQKKGELTLKLLLLCITLQAREEGLALLKILGSDFGSQSFEGIQNDQVAQAIAEFECYVTGNIFI